MSLEKLQLIATTSASPAHKVNWLRWWNSNIRKDLHFPTNTTDDTLTKWLARAAFWENLEDVASKQLLQYYDLVGGLDKSKSFEKFSDYMEDCRVSVWEKAFLTYFSGSDLYKKGTIFKDFKDSGNVVKRLWLRSDTCFFSSFLSLIF